MLRLFNNSYPLTLLIIFLLSIALWLPAIAMPHEPLQDGSALYMWLTGWMSPRLLTGINAVLAALTAVTAAVVYDRDRLTGRQSYLPGLVFALMAGMCPAYWGSSAIIPATFLLLPAIHYMLAYRRNNRTASCMFNATFIIGIAALIYFPAAGLFVSVLLAHVYFNRPNLRHIIIAMLGFILPSVFCLAIYVLAGHHINRMQLPMPAMPGGWQFHHLLASPASLMQIVCVLLIGIICFPAFVQQINRSTLLNRRALMLIFWTGCLLMLLLANRSDALLLSALAAAPAATIYYGVHFLTSRHKMMSGLLLWVLLLISIANQYLILRQGF